jgi:signal recognition particle subunit SRP54
VLTRVDGDGRGGAALSMRAVTGKPIKLIGVGEKWDALEDFHPGRIAGRILGMGDVVSLVEKAAQSIDIEKAQAIAAKMRKGAFDLEDLADQLKQMEKLGGMSSMLGLLPGIGKIKRQIDEANLDDRVLKRQRAIILSMTPKERRNPKMLDGKRKRRIAAGSGTRPEDVNRLLKMHRQMADMMKTMGKKGGMMQRMMGMGGGGSAPSPAELEKMQAELARLDPKALDALPKELRDQLPKGLPTGGGKPMPRLPGLPGLPGGAMPRFPGGLPGLPGKKK